ncbi:hypothetical protein FOYG_10315 [Fusarium oxysporum NRRL 32931]|uniref:Uncharacterized protein n=1 Tax=Fusarium oxysporum NRRL 32931 TaxID=660029 RepID=W9IAH8_FUSOX|nr:hypothetical protein FOYG_10315 [Fusarium oxysporum NRRL 32931]
MKNAVEKALWDTNESHPSHSEIPTARFDNKEVQESSRCYDGPSISLIKGIECRVREHQDYKDYTLVLNIYAAGTGESVLCSHYCALVRRARYVGGSEDPHRIGMARLFTTITNQLD